MVVEIVALLSILNSTVKTVALPAGGIIAIETLVRAMVVMTFNVVNLKVSVSVCAYLGSIHRPLSLNGLGKNEEDQEAKDKQ